MTQQKSKKRMAERRAQRRRESQTRLIIGITAAVVVVVALIVLLTLQSGNKLIFVAGDYEGLPQNVEQTDAVGLVIGEPTAPVTLVEYSDFSCSHCKNLSPTINGFINQYVRDGRLKMIYKPVSFIGGANSEAASRAAICAAAQGKGWQMIDFAWGLSGAGSYNLEVFKGIDPSVGLDTDAFTQCFNARATAQAAQAVNNEATGKGISSTPTLFVNNVQLPLPAAGSTYSDVVTQAIEAALGG